MLLTFSIIPAGIQELLVKLYSFFLNFIIILNKVVIQLLDIISYKLILIMWNLLINIPQAVIGHNIFIFLNVESIARLETAVASSKNIQTLRSLLSYLSKLEEKVNIPEEITKLKWLQVHDYPIAKAIVHLDKINSTFETNTIKGIELIGLNSNISTELHYLPATCYEKIVSVYFYLFMIMVSYTKYELIFMYF